MRIPGTGKRDGLAYGFRAISPAPDDDAVVAVIDGDTVLDHGVVKKTVPWFKLFPTSAASLPLKRRTKKRRGIKVSTLSR